MKDIELNPVKVLDIELSRPLLTPDGLEGYETLRALVRLHGVPIGSVTLPVINGQCSAMLIGQAILEQLNQPIICHLVSDRLAILPLSGGLEVADLLNVRHAAYTGPHPLVTVAVCSRDRTDDLAVCLEALNRLDYQNLDLLVVDNAPSTPATERLVRDSYPNVRYICEPRPGLDWARNRAIVEARGQIIAYTDDDVVVDPSWVTAVANVFAEDPQVMAVTGLVVPYELETEAQVLFERYGGFGRGFTRRWYQVDKAGGELTAQSYAWAGRFGTGANMAFRRSLFQQIGPFDPALDVGTASNGGGDIEMFFRLLKEGHALVYEPSALVRHRHRRDYASLRKQIADIGIGFTAYLVRSALAYPDERWAILRFWQWWLREWLLRRLIKSWLGRETFPHDLIVAELWGYFAGLWRYPRARRTAGSLGQATISLA